MAKAKVVKNPAVAGITQIKSNDDLYNVALATVLAFADRLPGLMTFEIGPKASWVAADGKSHKGNFAILSVYIKSKRSPKYLIDSFLLGQLGAPFGGAQGLNAEAVSGALTDTLQQSISSYLPVVGAELPGVTAPPSPATPPSTTLQTQLSKYRISLLREDSNIRVIEQGGYGFIGGSRSITDPSNFLSVTGIDPNSLENVPDSSTLYQRFGSIMQTSKSNISSQGLIDIVNQYVQNEKSLSPAAASAATPAVSGLASLQAQFKENEAYKYPNNSTLYIYQSGRLRGVANGNAFARFYGKTWNGKADLNTVHKILPMPNLTSFNIPPDFFGGTLIQ